MLLKFWGPLRIPGPEVEGYDTAIYRKLDRSQRFPHDVTVQAKRSL